MIEVYGMALLRDLPLGEYPKSGVSGMVIAALNAFGEHFIWGYDAHGNAITAADREVAPENLFRGPTPGDLAGAA